MLNVSALAVSYGMHEALSSVNLHVASDEIVVILGANGAGKSTLLKAIAGNCEGKVLGAVTFDGSDISSLDAALIVERGIAFVPEGRGIFGDLSVLENLQLGAYTEHARQLQDNNLQRVFTLFPKLRERQKQIARTMSGGEQQMVAIGRALMSAPSILMLDEPSLGLSPLLCKELFSSLERVRKSGVGILLVEQNAKQSLGIADRGYILENGKITGEDSASQLLHDPAVQAAYLGGSSVAAKNAVSARSKVKTIIINPDAPSPYTPANAINDSGLRQQPATNTMPVSFTPADRTLSPHTVTTTSLLDEDVDDLVARATSVAAPGTVKQTSFVQTAPVASPAASADSLRLNSAQDVALMSKDTEVQKMLAGFEEAARSASSGKKYRTSRANRSTGAGKSGNGSIKNSVEMRTVPVEIDSDFENLPNIPVYRNKPVTVYKRNSAGQLKKQERN